MAELRATTSIGGNLVWHGGNLKFDPQGNTIRFKSFKMYTENDKPTTDEINAVNRSGDTMTGTLILPSDTIGLRGSTFGDSGVYFNSDGRTVIGGHNASGVGGIQLRPNGITSGNNQVQIDTSGNMTVNGNLLNTGTIRSNGAATLDSTLSVGSSITSGGTITGGTFVQSSSVSGTLLSMPNFATGQDRYINTASGDNILKFSKNGNSDYNFQFFASKLRIQTRVVIDDQQDGWLRLNPSSDYGQGIFTPSIFRADNGLLVGSGGSKFHVNSTGKTTIADDLEVTGYSRVYSTDGKLNHQFENASSVSTYRIDNAGGWRLWNGSSAGTAGAIITADFANNNISIKNPRSSTAQETNAASLVRYDYLNTQLNTKFDKTGGGITGNVTVDGNILGDTYYSTNNIESADTAQEDLLDGFWYDDTSNGTSLGYPEAYGVLINTALNANRGMQMFASKANNYYVRSADASLTNGWTDFAQIYTTNYKPTAADVGAVDKTGDTMSGALTVNSTINASGIVYGQHFHVNGTDTGFLRIANWDTGDTKFIYRQSGDNIIGLKRTTVNSYNMTLYGTEFAFSSRTAFRSVSDNWLRINPNNDYTEGVFFGSSLVRTDGEIQIGNHGGTFDVNGSKFTYKGNDVYHEGNKPSASDTGSVDKTGDSMSGKLTIQNGLGTNGDNTSLLELKNFGPALDFHDLSTAENGIPFRLSYQDQEFKFGTYNQSSDTYTEIVTLDKNGYFEGGSVKKIQDNTQAVGAKFHIYKNDGGGNGGFRWNSSIWDNTNGINTATGGGCAFKQDVGVDTGNGAMVFFRSQSSLSAGDEITWKAVLRLQSDFSVYVDNDLSANTVHARNGNSNTIPDDASMAYRVNDSSNNQLNFIHNKEAIREWLGIDDVIQVSKEEILKSLYDIGDFFITQSSANPSTKFGGTWTLVGNDTVLTAGTSSNVVSDSLSYVGTNTPSVPLLAHTHNITVSSTNLGTKNTSSTGNHNHSISKYSYSDVRVGGLGDTASHIGGSGSTNTSTNGNHHHTVVLGSHAHSASASTTGQSSPTLDVRGKRIYVYIWKRTA